MKGDENTASILYIPGREESKHNVRTKRLFGRRQRRSTAKSEKKGELRKSERVREREREEGGRKTNEGLISAGAGWVEADDAANSIEMHKNRSFQLKITVVAWVAE